MRKNTIVIITLIAALLIPFAAFAMSQNEWDYQCQHKTTGTVTLYESGDTGYEAAGTLENGTYVKAKKHLKADQKWLIEYLDESGEAAQGYVDDDAIAAATVKVTFDNGSTESVPEALLQDTPALLKYLHGKHPDYTYTMGNNGIIKMSYTGAQLVEDDSLTDDSGEDVSAQTIAATEAPAPAKATEAPAAEKEDETPAKAEATAAPAAPAPTPAAVSGMPSGGKLVSVGSANSVVKVGKSEIVVETLSLVENSKAKEEHRVAYVSPTKGGSVALRAKPNKKGKVVKRIGDGRMMLVLEIADGFAHVQIDDKLEGYIATASLTYVEAGTEPTGSGVLHLYGKTNGRAKINIRGKASSSSRKIVKVKTGTTVNIFGQNGKFYEVEINGYHGFVHQDYINVQ